METQHTANNRKQEIDLDTWVRKDHFKFFSQFSEPFFGVVFRVDCTAAYQRTKELKQSFFVHYLYQALRAANETEAFRYRIADGKVYLYEAVHASPTINRPDGTFGFAYMDYLTDESAFHRHAATVMAEVRSTSGLVPARSGQNVIHCSALPWLDFTGLSHARNFAFPDSCPKISFGKVTEQEGRRSMPISVHVHHALADGYHVGQFAERFSALLGA